MTADRLALQREEMRMALRSHFTNALRGRGWRASFDALDFVDLLTDVVDAAEIVVHTAQQEARTQALAEAAHVARMAASRYEELVDIQVTDTSRETYRLFSGIANRIAVGIGELAKGGNDA